MSYLELNDLSAERVGRLMGVCPAAPLSARRVGELFDLVEAKRFDGWQLMYRHGPCAGDTCPGRGWHPAAWAMVRGAGEGETRPIGFGACLTFTRRDGRYRVVAGFAPGQEYLAADVRRAAYAEED